ncbi:MAG: OmpA family protein [Rhodobacteraceae bacterium]|nr:OmpA family protein [Paracoccaceae bacterium]
MVRFKFNILCTALFVATGLAAADGGLAQSATDMTAEEITDAFTKQKTRGLVIVPSGQQSGSAATESTSITTGGNPAYSAVARDDQVNVQIAFDFDSAALRDDQKPKLDTLCQVMRSIDVAVFQIIGHTDSSGTAQYNQRLSLLRAQEVKRHLVGTCGLDANRLEAIGMGESVPFDAANPRADVNRRVEFQALG